jgi:cytidylate kinase
MTIISISGLIGSGKDTAAEYLVRERGFVRTSFAATLKDAIADIFHWDRTLLEGLTTEAREWREQVDPWWSNRLDMPNLTPRWVLQYWGTEVARNNFHQDIWIASLEKKLSTSQDNIVISDARFLNEFAMLKQLSACTVWVKRSPFPEWYYLAVKANQGCRESQAQLQKLGIHSSETCWAGYKFDREIQNDFTVSYLYQCIDNLLEDLQ